MRSVSADDLSGIFNFADLIEALRDAFRRGVIMPTRHHHAISLHGEPNATLLLMPAWDDLSSEPDASGFLGVKVISVYPGNAARGKPSVSGSYLLVAGNTGEALAVIDGSALTLWRTAAASALAASYLARRDASRLVMVGAGALAPFLIAAHASVRPISDVLVWNRSIGRAEAVAAALSSRSYSVLATPDLEGAIRTADVVSCATLSTEPLVRGAWLEPGTHLDLIGAFTPTMRESDDEAVRRSRLYVDTRDGALKEGGDLVIPLRAGVRRDRDVLGDLFELCRGTAPGRGGDAEITLFKSVGSALEDLAAATLAYTRLTRTVGSHTA